MARILRAIHLPADSTLPCDSWWTLTLHVRLVALFLFSRRGDHQVECADCARVVGSCRSLLLSGITM